MPNIPDDIQRKIEQLEALRPTFGDDALVDEMIAKLRAPAAPAPTASQQQQAGGSITNSPPTVEHDHSTQGTATTSGNNRGQNVGAIIDTMQQFFGGQPPVDGEKLLAAYLASLTSECQQLRLQRLVDQAQSGTEQQAVPQLKLQAVYTGLTTNGEPVVVHRREYPAEKMVRLAKRLRQRPADEVPPAQVREIEINFCTPPDDAFYRQIGKQRGESLTFDDIPADTPLRLMVTRPELATESIN